MNYKALNADGVRRISHICNPAAHFEWEDHHIMDFLLGNLPKLQANGADNKVPDQYYELKRQYESYHFFETNSKNFIQSISCLVRSIQKEIPYWFGLSIPEVEETLKTHKSCLISGEGGIGKSYFVKCFEQELEIRNIQHLCVYGKFTKDISIIDFDEIAQLGECGEFVFVFDAINEIGDKSQCALLEELQKIKNVRGLRIIVTYRTGTVDETILSEYRKLAESLYDFPGVSFESAVEWLRKAPVKDITEYLDVLYSNNAFLLGQLHKIMQGREEKDHKLNNVSRFTYIYEQYIRRSFSVEMWRDTKTVTKFMYESNQKEIAVEKLVKLIGSGNEYISKMEQSGFLTRYTREGAEYCAFTIESLSDYLLARCMWNDIKDKPTSDCAEIIKTKIKKIHGISEMVIILLFDKFSPDYQTIKTLLIDTNLIEDFTYNTAVKINFNPTHVEEFIKVFKPSNKSELFEYFAGYLNKPFNCTNYLNKYYLENEAVQTKELTQRLSRNHFLEPLKSRLKNALYFICKCSCDDERAYETFFTALWCTAAGNQEVGSLAIKLLYEVMQHNPRMIHTAIQVFPSIKDYYIQDSLIQALSAGTQNEEVVEFFKNLLADPVFTLAKSIRRMCEYLGQPAAYIDTEKNNLYFNNGEKASEDFQRMLCSIDLFEKDLLPFRFWGVQKFRDSVKFLAVDKRRIAELNDRIAKDFSCVQNGECSGWMGFQRKMDSFYSVSYANNTLNGDAMLASMESVFREIFTLYGLEFDSRTYRRHDEQEFGFSIFRKCTCIAIDIFYGSLMCNYYTKEFATFNNTPNTIGYEIYDPLEYQEKMNIRSPLSIYQPQIEQMGDEILNAMDYSVEKDERWWRDLELTKRNLLQVLQPIKCNGQEWVLLAGRVFVHENAQPDKWKDTYDIFCCTSAEETIKADGNARYLTIELDEYNGNLSEYEKCAHRPWLCKSVPTISYSSQFFEDVILYLPPASIISVLDLKLNLEEMSWQNSDGEKIIICNNNKSSYYNDQIMGTVFIRKDAYEQFLEYMPIKYFAFAERYLESRGFCDDTSVHFEIKDGKITKSIMNYFPRGEYVREPPPEKCQRCIYGFYKAPSVDNPLRKFMEEHPDFKALVEKYGQ